jgi:hypothetical protein
MSQPRQTCPHWFFTKTPLIYINPKNDAEHLLFWTNALAYFWRACSDKEKEFYSLDTLYLLCFVFQKDVLNKAGVLYSSGFLC